jgi:hypothetical protein
MENWFATYIRISVFTTYKVRQANVDKNMRKSSLRTKKTHATTSVF